MSALRVARAVIRESSYLPLNKIPDLCLDTAAGPASQLDTVCRSARDTYRRFREIKAFLDKLTRKFVALARNTISALLVETIGDRRAGTRMHHPGGLAGQSKFDRWLQLLQLVSLRCTFRC
jgi:hypothetical protein